jgi:hypothetical protein
MFGFEPVDNTGWQPDGWNLPLEETRDGPDVYSGGVDPDLLPPSDEGVYVPQSTDIAAELTVTENSNKRSADPEVVRAVIRDQCLQGIDECLTIAQEGGPAGSRIFSDETGNFTKEGKLLRDMICEAVLDDDAAAVAAHTERLKALPSYTTLEILVEAQFAAAVLGDADAADVVHVALKDEQNSNWAKKQHIIEMRMLEPSDLDKSQRPSIHSTIIKRCVDYGIPADHWINTYAVDIEDRFAKMAHYLHLRIRTAGPDADKAVLQQAFDEHMTQVVDLPLAFTVRQIPLLLERTGNPAMRMQLVDRFIADTQRTPLSLESFRDTMRVGRTMLDDPLLATDDRHRFFALAQHQYGQMLMKSHAYASVIDASYPFTEARMHHRDADAEEIIRNIDKLAQYTFQIVHGDTEWGMEAIVASRDARLSSSAYRFTRKDDFNSAHLLVSAMSPGAAQQSMWAECFEMAKTATDLQALQVDEMTLAVEPILGLHHEIATLRIAGNAEELIAQAASHARAIRELDSVDDSREGSTRRSDNAMHLEYVNAACGAIGRLGNEQFLAAARQLLPELRNFSKLAQSVKSLSEALIFAGDPDEPVRALGHIHQIPRESRGDRMQALWNLATVLRRADRAQA